MAVSELPGNPNAVWTVKRNTEGTCPADHIVLLPLYSATPLPPSLPTRLAIDLSLDSYI